MFDKVVPTVLVVLTKYINGTSITLLSTNSNFCQILSTPFPLARNFCRKYHRAWKLITSGIMSSNYRTSASRAAKYDYLIKLLLIGDSGENNFVCTRHTCALNMLHSLTLPLKKIWPKIGLHRCGQILFTVEVFWRLIYIFVYYNNRNWFQDKINIDQGLKS